MDYDRYGKNLVTGGKDSTVSYFLKELATALFDVFFVIR